MARTTMTEEQRALILQGTAAAKDKRADAFENRFICGGWTVFNLNPLNTVLQPADQEREDTNDREHYGNFRQAVEYGLLPKMVAAMDKRSVQSILDGYAALKREVLDALAARGTR